MTTKNNKLVRNGLVLLTIVALGFGAYSFINPNPKENADPAIESEKTLILTELEDMSNAYDVAIKESKEKDVALENAKLKIETLIDSLKNTKSSVKELISLKTKQLELNSEMKNLIRENKELKQDNQILVHSLNKRKAQLNQKDKLYASLKTEKEALIGEKEGLNKVINEARFLNLLDLKVEGIKERSSGKQVTTTKAKRVNKFKICYAIAKNPLVKEGYKTMQVQVLDPNNKVLASNKNTLKNKENNLEYTFNTSFDYKNDNLNVCDYLDFKEDKTLEKGKYLINVYDGKTLVTTSEITLK